MWGWICGSQFPKDQIDTADVCTCSSEKVWGRRSKPLIGRTMFAAGPSNCCLSNNSHFQQTPIPIFHLVFKIATQSSGLLVDPTCRRGKTGKKVTALLTQPVNWLTVGQYGHRRPFVGVNIFHYILLCVFQCDVLSKGKAMKIQIFNQWMSVLIFMKVKLEMKFSTFFSGNEKEQRMRFFWKTPTHVGSRHLILNIKKVKYFFAILPCTCSYYANS